MGRQKVSVLGKAKKIPDNTFFRLGPILTLLLDPAMLWEIELFISRKSKAMFSFI